MNTDCKAKGKELYVIDELNVMKKKIVEIGTVHQCNCWLGGKTLHPLVSVIDLSNTDLTQHIVKFGFYTILLRECPCEDFIYGRQNYDYSNGTVVFLAPGQSINTEGSGILPLKGWMLVFHPDLIHGTSLGQNIKNYTFFSYHLNEALHLSIREKQKVLECLENVRQELLHAIDWHSKILISRYIELLLDHCTRFYERQFITRAEANKELFTRFECILDTYFETDQPKTSGLLSAEYCADLLHLSSYYFEDLLKQETGKDTQEYLQFKRISIAQKQLRSTDKTISQIAEKLGYPTPQLFSDLFKKIVGCTPNEFRILN